MKNKMMRIGIVGDIALTHDYDVLQVAKGPHYPFDLIRNVLGEYDVMIGNLEAPFCMGGETYPLKLSLRAHPGYVAGLKEAGFTAVTLGNNHILDYRETAFYETMDILDSYGIKWCGAGRDLAEASKPAIIEKNGITIGLFSCCDVDIDSPFYASEGLRGIAPLDITQLEKDIDSFRDKVDFIIVSPHWGMEDWLYPNPDQTEKAHRMIDAGADLVIGHHPHVIQGIERYKNGCIAYSLGNFLFSDVEWRWLNLQGELRNSQRKQSRARKQTMIFSVDITKRGIREFRTIPCRIGNDLRVTTQEKPQFFNVFLSGISKPISMKNYEAFWYWYHTYMIYKLAFLGNARRLKNIYKLRPAHIRELMMIIREARSQHLPMK